MNPKRAEIHLKGTPISRGIAIGKTFFLSSEDEEIPVFNIHAEEIEAEVLRYRRAVLRGCEELGRLQKQMDREKIFEGAAILDSYLQIMKDPLLTDCVENEIRQTCLNAEHVFQTTIRNYQNRFSKISDPFFRERFKDIQDISRRVIRHLKDSFRVSLAQTSLNSIIFAYDLAASDASEANIDCVCAFVTTSGGATSHTAIVARAKGIPYVTNVPLKGLNIDGDVGAIVDGRTGDVFLNPTVETIKRYTHLKEIVDKHIECLNTFTHTQAETYDGYAMRLSANIEMAHEVAHLHQYGADGIGLYRSEYDFLSQESFPTEEEQFNTYRQMVEMMHGLPVVIRTFDVGGDKQMLCSPPRQENNPIMGCRAIRFLLQEKELFRSQLRAILRASAYGDVSILFPMVSALSELLEAKALLEDVKKALYEEDIPFAEVIRIGCMIEVPSAAVIADLLAKECDFLSIGTNDLVQYSLAVDRGNELISGLYTPTHPSVIRLIKLVVHEANYEGIPVTVCGEIAGDPRFTPLLIGLGVHELSVAPRSIPAIKNAIRSASIVEATSLTEKILQLISAAEIQEYLSQEYRRLVPDDCFYNC